MQLIGACGVNNELRQAQDSLLGSVRHSSATATRIRALKATELGGVGWLAQDQPSPVQGTFSLQQQTACVGTA
jgi:hypothetical protein